MSEIVIDNKESMEYFENLDIYRMAFVMTAIFRYTGNCIFKTILKSYLTSSEEWVIQKSDSKQIINVVLLFWKTWSGDG